MVDDFDDNKIEPFFELFENNYIAYIDNLKREIRSFFFTIGSEYDSTYNIIFDWMNYVPLSINDELCISSDEDDLLNDLRKFCNIHKKINTPRELLPNRVDFQCIRTLSVFFDAKSYW